MNADENREHPDRGGTGAALSEALYRSYLHALLEGDRVRCKDTVDDVLERKRTVHELYEDVFHRSLYEVGELWERGRISVADEHLATAMTESLLTRVYPHLFETPRAGYSAVVSCVVNEYHQIGGKMVADIFEMHGWDSYFLGANTPQAELVDMVGQKKPDVVALSISIYSGMANLVQTVETLRKPFGDLEIWVGGQAFNWGGKNLFDDYPNVYPVQSLSDMETRLKLWKNKQ